MTGRFAYLGLSLCLLAAPAAALPHAPADLVRLFSICAGRYSALAEHEALFDGDARSKIEYRGLPICERANDAAGLDRGPPI